MDNIKGSTIAWILVRVCLYCAVAVIVLYKLKVFKDRPTETHTYYTNDPNKTKPGYTCGCTLPASLQEKNKLDTKSVSLNICYESSSLETVTVLMYSDSAAILVPELEPAIKELASYNITNRTMEGWEGGYRVNQEAHDLHGYIAQAPVLSGIQDLFLNGYREPEIYPYIQYLRNPDFMTFPRAYLRMTLTFHCNNCSNCSLDAVNDMANNVVVNGSIKDAVWANCFYWGQDDKCASNNSYEARCLLYPTEALPPNFAIHTFLDAFMTQLVGVSIVRTDQGGSSQVEYPSNSTTLQPSSLYLNVSQVENSTNPIRYGFVEVVKSSALWASLLNLFPTLGDCSAVGNVTVCNGTSVCNVFTNANDYDLRCHDMKNKTQCEDLMGGPEDIFTSTFDNAGNLLNDIDPRNVPWLDLECPEFKCLEVPPYTLIWNTSESMQNDSFNRFLSSRILNDDWGQRSGVCTNTYENVLRFPLATAAASGPQARAKLNDSHSKFLQSNCTNSGYCWLTGYYRNINDTPREEWKRMPEDLFPNPDPDSLFVCYRLDDKDFGSWFVTTMGVLYGWIGTVELLLRWFARPMTPFVHKFHQFMQDRKHARIPRPALEENGTPQGGYGEL